MLLLLALLATAPDPSSPQFTSIVRDAYRYAGNDKLKAGPGKQLVAIDIEFTGYDNGLDLDDVEILDATNSQVFDAAPEIAFLHADGTLYSWNEKDPDSPMRVLLVYEIPKTVKKIQLRLWDEALTKELTIAAKPRARGAARP